jgi:hypothetical protein
MATYRVRQIVEYWADGIEAESEDQARDIYLQDQDSYYYQVISEDIEIV